MQQKVLVALAGKGRGSRVESVQIAREARRVGKGEPRRLLQQGHAWNITLVPIQGVDGGNARPRRLPRAAALSKSLTRTPPPATASRTSASRPPSAGRSPPAPTRNSPGARPLTTSGR